MKTFVCPHLEYWVQVWFPHLRKVINTLERIQIRLVSEFSHLTYNERLHRLGLMTLEKRGSYQGIQNSLPGKESIDSAKFFSLLLMIKFDRLFDQRRVALRSAPVTCATAVAHSLMQRLRPRERSKYSWITKTSHPWT